MGNAAVLHRAVEGDSLDGLRIPSLSPLNRAIRQYWETPADGNRRGWRLLQTLRAELTALKYPQPLALAQDIGRCVQALALEEPRCPRRCRLERETLLYCLQLELAEEFDPPA